MSSWHVFWLYGLSCLVGATIASSPVWRWECRQGTCVKERVDDTTADVAISLAACQLACLEYAALWPQPTGPITIGNYLVHVNVNSIDIAGISTDSEAADLFREAFQRFKKQTEAKGSDAARNSGGKSLFLYVTLSDPAVTDLTLKTDEGYSLTLSEGAAGSINATIEANNFFGARHGLETLGQLVIYDDLRDRILVPRDVQVMDAPVYPYRSILLDTSRNFISVDVIKRNIDAMAASKMNRFHWHITDTHSFPFYSKSRPELSKLGAYSPKKVYTPEQITDIVEYARVRGVKIVPEFDAPAHVGEGWQDTGYVVCLNKQPWNKYCVEPPCGQFDPTKEGLYNVLDDIYSDMLELFNPDVFHMGGDEVSFHCWKSVNSIVQWIADKEWNTTSEEEDFIKLWDHFQTSALARLDSQTTSKLPIIMWTSTLTQAEYVEQYLPKDRYIIQIWTRAADLQVNSLLEAGYNLILSNYDALYLDCGFSGWVKEGNNWCSPYIGWQKVYSNKPIDIGGSRTSQILGAEATLWTEQADDSSVDGRFWPRAAAMAEVFWSEPENTWREAERRMLIHRDRLVRDTGVNAEALEPEWCLQNEDNCPEVQTNNFPL